MSRSMLLSGQRASVERLRRGVTLLLGLAVLVQLSMTVGRVLAVSKRLHALHRPPPSSASSSARSNNDAALAQHIIAAHLFGAPPAQATAANAAPQDLKLELTLIGTLAEQNPEKGFAIIRLGSQRTDLFAAHAQIDAATRLLRIFADHVVVDWRGSERVLALPREGGTPLVLSSNELTLPPAATDDEPEEEVRGTGVTYPHTANYRTILDNIDYSPRMVGDKVNGIEIVSAKDEDKLEKIGLHEGDVVTYVNGELINSPSRIDELLKALSDGKTVTATIIRDGEASSELLQGNP